MGVGVTRALRGYFGSPKAGRMQMTLIYILIPSEERKRGERRGTPSPSVDRQQLHAPAASACCSRPSSPFIAATAASMNAHT